MIIIEGTDLTGKTTLAKRLVTELCSQREWHIYQHMSMPPEGWDYYGDYIVLMQPRTVWDRFHMGNLVYQEVDGTGTRHTPISYEMLDANVRIHAGIVVVCTIDDQTLIRRWQDKPHGDEMFPLSTIRAANERYIALCERRVLGWQPLIDFHFHNEGDSWPAEDEEAIDQLLTSYLERFKTWSMLMT